MIDDSIDGLPLELLAAYVDGELDPALRERVERWLAQHPEAFAEQMEQESLSPANEEYWQSVAPPQPGRTAWERAFAGIEAALMPVARPVSVRGRRLKFFVTATALASMAAALMIAIWAIDRTRPIARQPQPATVVVVPDDDEDFIFHVARAEDVELIRVPEDAADLLVVGKHPLADDPLVLVTSSDFQVLNYGLDDQGEVPDYQTMIGSNTPMFVAPPRRK
jgi:anti-sigma factor RsiW